MKKAFNETSIDNLLSKIERYLKDLTNDSGYIGDKTLIIEVIEN